VISPVWMNCEGKTWIDNAAFCQKGGLKHRVATEIRTIPISPSWSGGSAHIRRYGTTPMGGSSRLHGAASFRTPLTAPRRSTRGRLRSPRRSSDPTGSPPDDLLHAVVSLWLNSVVPRHRGRPPRRARAPRPAEDLRPLHRRPGGRGQPAH